MGGFGAWIVGFGVCLVFEFGFGLGFDVIGVVGMDWV